MIVAPVYALHHDPDIYEDPEEFRPERFEPDEFQKRPICAFMPFAQGPRNCLALKMGMMQMHGGLTTILKNYEVSIVKPRGDIVLNRKSIVLESKDGIHINFFPL